MRIALFHNLGPGGAKRHLYEQARELHVRGHTLDLFIPATADEVYLPLAPYCREVRVYGARTATASVSEAGATKADALRRLARTLFGEEGHDLLAEWYWARQHRTRVETQATENAEIARDIDAGGYDVAYVHQCALTLAPDMLRFLGKTPTVFVCNDTARWAYEWALDGPADYDSRIATFWRRKCRGRLLSPFQRHMMHEADRQFVDNTRAATLVLSNSCYSRECTVRATGTNPRVCYPGVDTDYFTSTEKLPSRTPLVLSVGALLPNKQHEFILRSVAAISSDRRPMLEIVGYESPPIGGSGEPGPEGKRLHDLACALGVDLTLRRDVTDESLREAYRRATVVAFAPYLEPFGLVALEAMSCATPVVGVREGGIRETVSDGETGFLTDRDTDAFADAVDRVLAEPELAHRLGKAGRERVCRDWTWARSTDVAESWLSQVAMEGRR